MASLCRTSPEVACWRALAEITDCFLLPFRRQFDAPEAHDRAAERYTGGARRLRDADKRGGGGVGVRGQRKGKVALF